MTVDWDTWVHPSAAKADARGYDLIHVWPHGWKWVGDKTRPIEASFNNLVRYCGLDDKGKPPQEIVLSPYRLRFLRMDGEMYIYEYAGMIEESEEN